MVISLLPLPRTMVALAQLGYPLAQLGEVAKSGAALSSLDYAQWVTYWIICALWMFLENNFLWLLVEYFPLFLEFKLCFFIWLAHPTYKGAAYLWYGHIQTVHRAFDDEHYAAFIGTLEKAKLPDSVKPEVDLDGSDKAEEVNKLLKEAAEADD
mmetsp:Transcript_22202/g.66440  ORF Transcript_22202/g.66440 Transcript_22202/m.66440 type:complete len:154 (-) Transcript_22202:181-642(-)